MKIFLNETVYAAAIERIEYIFDEFENVIVSFSGGKDSTVTLELALEVARKRNRFPLKVFFLDQEAEWRSVIDYVREVMGRDEIEPQWIQVPIFLPNSISQDMPYLVTWEPGKKWMREKDPLAITEGIELKGEAEKEAKVGYWYTYFVKYMAQMYPDEPACFLAGMRAEESPQRLAGLTTGQTYKAVTWGRKLDEKRKHFTFYPIYDWTISDVWKYIHDNAFPYCKIYDEYFRYGLPIRDMRVSNLHHESAVKSLFYLHELEADTWDAMNQRLNGVNQAKHISKEELLATKKLPFMFDSWREYRDYLTEKLILDEKHRDIFTKKWAEMDKYYAELADPDEMHRSQIKSILVNDIEFAKLSSYINAPHMIVFREWVKGKLHARPRQREHLRQIKGKHIAQALEGSAG